MVPHVMFPLHHHLPCGCWLDELELERGKTLTMPIKFTNGISSLLHKIEGWEPLPCPRLPETQCDDHKEHLPLALDSKHPLQGVRSQIKVFHKIRHPLVVQKCTNQGRRQRKG